MSQPFSIDRMNETRSGVGLRGSRKTATGIGGSSVSDQRVQSTPFFAASLAETNRCFKETNRPPSAVRQMALPIPRSVNLGSGMDAAVAASVIDRNHAGLVGTSTMV